MYPQLIAGICYVCDGAVGKNLPASRGDLLREDRLPTRAKRRVQRQRGCCANEVAFPRANAVDFSCQQIQQIVGTDLDLIEALLRGVELDGGAGEAHSISAENAEF